MEPLMREHNLYNDTADNFHTGRKVVGNTVVQVVTVTLADLVKGIQVKAGAGNTDIIYVGKDGCTDGTAVTTDGMQLSAGQGVFIPVKDVALVYAIADAASQDLYWLAI
jgi:hypothetical protein